MKAMQISEYGDADVLTAHDVDRPVPKDRQILVKVYDAGVNPFDWKVRRGYAKEYLPVHFPHTLGYDFAGEVVEVGKSIQSYKPGDRVFGFATGSFAEFAVCREEKIARLPEEVDFDVAATLPTPGCAAYQIMIGNVRPRNPNRILIHGAAGGVGLLVVQLARSLGITVYANAAKADEKILKSLGVERVIDYKTERFEELCKDLDAIIDLVGGSTLERSFQCVKKGGFVISSVGPEKKDLALKSGVDFSLFAMEPRGSDLQKIIDLVMRGTIKPHSMAVIPLEKAADALLGLETGKIHDKVVLQVN